MVLRFAILSLGVFCAATSVVMTKASQLSPEILSSGRLLVAVVILLPIFIRDKKRQPDFSLKESIKVSSLPALLLALHFVSWTIGARWTTSANSTLIVNLIPVAMPVLSIILLRESLNKKEWIGTTLTVLGVVVLAYVDYRISSTLIAGDMVCVLSMILLAWYLILARKNKSVPSICLYLVPLYAQAGILCLAAGLVRTGLPLSINREEWKYILLLGLIPTVFGHSLLNLAMRWFRSQFVAIVSQLQFVYAGFLGYFFFREIPHNSFYLASAFMMAGVLWTLLAHAQSKKTDGRSPP
jgi:drug/metabolite transporter (DMT)-like permease